MVLSAAVKALDSQPFFFGCSAQHTYSYFAGIGILLDIAIHAERSSMQRTSYTTSKRTGTLNFLWNSSTIDNDHLAFQELQVSTGRHTHTLEPLLFCSF